MMLMLMLMLMPPPCPPHNILHTVRLARQQQEHVRFIAGR